MAAFRVLTITIPDEEAHTLDELARSQYRRPRDQASILVIEALQHISEQIKRERAAFGAGAVEAKERKAS
jgi:predicted transcriptional regulator